MRTSSNTTELSALFGPGPICAALSLMLPLGLLVYSVAAFPSQAMVLAGLLAFVLFAQAAVAARSDALSVGIAVTGLMLALSEAGFIMMGIAGTILFLTFVLHDLSRSLRRRPAVTQTFVRGLTIATVGVIVVGWLLAAASAAVAGATVWPALIIPVAVVAIGLFVFISVQQLISHDDHLEPGRS